MADVRFIGFFELLFYKRITGGPVGFDPEEPVTRKHAVLLHARHAVPLANIETVMWG